MHGKVVNQTCVSRWLEEQISKISLCIVLLEMSLHISEEVILKVKCAGKSGQAY